jgi:Protein of unknown function (DUF1190)
MASTRIYLAASILAAAILGACGKAPDEKKAEGPPPDHGVFVSTTDCAASGKLSEDLCGKAIDDAVAAHLKQATVYKFARQCEAAEGGPERCDKAGQSEYRVRIQAFFVTMSDPPTAVPLYPPKDASATFRSPSKQTIGANDQSVHLSNDAQALANENAKLPGYDASAGATLGDAAGTIH